MDKTAMSRSDAILFSKRWLPAWTGNHPELLASFYSLDAYYWDGSIKDGLHGREAILGYFRKLLRQNPDWIWTQIDAVPMEGGFLNKWHATIPVGSKIIECVGVCTVEMKGGLISRNETYFDKSEWIQAYYKT